MINLISDTVTLPSQGMKEAMLAAPLGDDVFRQDPSINALEEYAADLFGHEAALFCPSGTMTNQIAIKMHTQPLDEMICDHYSHVYQYETGGYAYHSGISVRLLQGEYGKITADQISAAIHPDYDWLPNSRLVVLENSCNKGGGSYYTLDEIAPITALCAERDLRLHLDGARLFNVLVETGESTRDVGRYFDSISICLSKGLGAPVGSLLIGSATDLKRARKLRKVMGGGMRQAGMLAAAGRYALEHHIDRLQDDHAKANYIGDLLKGHDKVTAVRPIQTNIIIFSLESSDAVDQMLAHLETRGILATRFGPTEIRFVLHMDITDDMMPTIEKSIREF